MDSLDHDILEVLRKDARTPYTEIANRLHVSEGTIRNRVEAMVESGAIERFTVSTRTGNVKAMIEVEVAVGVDTESLAGTLADDREEILNTKTRLILDEQMG